MLRIGVLALILAAIFADRSAANVKHGPLLERLRRSPHYICDSGESGYHYPPPPPPPPFGPPPPPPPYWPPPPPPPPYWPPPPPPHYGHSGSLAYAAAQTDTSAGTKSEPIKEAPSASVSEASHAEAAPQGQGNAPCDSCAGGSAISNAQSDLGDAIAVAVARARTG